MAARTHNNTVTTHTTKTSTDEGLGKSSKSRVSDCHRTKTNKAKANQGTKRPRSLLAHCLCNPQVRAPDFTANSKENSSANWQHVPGKRFTMTTDTMTKI